MKKIITSFLFLTIFLGYAQTKEIDSLFIELAFQKQDSTKVVPYLHLIKSLYALKEYDRAMKYVQASEKLSYSFNYKKGIAETTFYKALYYAEKNDYINAISAFAKAKSLFTEQHDDIAIANINNNIGVIESERGNFTKGIEHSLAAIKVLEQSNLKKELCLAYTNLADTYYKINNQEAAINYNLKALTFQEQLKDSTEINNTYKRLSNLYYNESNHKKSIYYFEKSLNINSISDTLRASIYPKLGGEYLATKNYAKATKYLVKGYNLNRKSNNKKNLLTVLNNLGDLNLQKNRLKTAKKQLIEAGEIAKELNNKPELLKQYKLMKAVDSTQRNFYNAFIWQGKYYELKSELELPIEVINAPVINSASIDLNSEFNKLESPSLAKGITTPNNEETGSRLKFNHYNFIVYFLIFSLCISIFILVILYIKRNNNIKIIADLEEKKSSLELENTAFLEETQNLENVINVKDKLFSIISHDLKDSLSSITGFINLLKDGSLTKEEFDTLIPELSENANNASLLLFNLLNWSKSQMQSLEPKPSLFDVQEVFKDKVQLVEQRMEKKGITLMNNSLRDFAFADRSMFEIVIQNLLANALKFCKKGDVISITNHINNGSCIVSIADTGIGIPEANINKLFTSTPFTTSGTNNEKGTGLGLPICKELIELNNGKIWVESMVNVGSTFYIQLPKSKPLE
ncbi:ATP-binding protein [Algibacter sp. L4_22]|uniref:tetratricopeptide repeat-containing sensor histidine kinase n=1 Tax=Algibacter sp. L4_22 TaxID=2942477 RepID=UPI00201B6266|nr:ATP-binding protein [Algibacter sp. L4_22]MCL5129002.1 ATP-binding protein [Algibacter sp. L4_22]